MMMMMDRSRAAAKRTQEDVRAATEGSVSSCSEDDPRRSSKRTRIATPAGGSASATPATMSIADADTASAVMPLADTASAVMPLAAAREAWAALVRDGYNAMAATYHAGRAAKEAPNVAWLDGLRRQHGFPAAPGAKVVDLGCGGGVPVAKYFAERGYAVEGYDLSAEMVAIARGAVPAAKFHVARMEDLRLGAGSVDIVVSLFAIIHVPRVYHAALFSQIFSWLKPGTGMALLSLGGNDNAAQQETWHGVRMAWSHFDAATSLRMLRDAGFEVLGSEEEQCGGPGDPTETHLFVVLRRPSDGADEAAAAAAKETEARRRHGDDVDD